MKKITLDVLIAELKEDQTANKDRKAKKVVQEGEVKELELN